jgi:hypothetical protein
VDGGSHLVARVVVMEPTAGHGWESGRRPAIRRPADALDGEAYAGKTGRPDHFSGTASGSPRGLTSPAIDSSLPALDAS